VETLGLEIEDDERLNGRWETGRLRERLRLKERCSVETVSLKER
jgi:hypothetical protein